MSDYPEQEQPAQDWGGQPQTLGYRGDPGRQMSGVQATDKAIQALSATRPWVILFAVLLFIGLGFGAIGVLLFLLGGLAAVTQGGGGGAGIALFVMSLLQVVPLLLILFPALYLTRYAGAIGRLRASNSPADLEEALVAQKSYWKFIGIFTLVVIGLQLLALLVLLVLGGIGAANANRGLAPAAPPNSFVFENAE